MRTRIPTTRPIHWRAVGAGALVAVALLCLISLQGCGGGDPEPPAPPTIVATGESTTSAGQAGVGASALTAPISGPTFTLAQPATVTIEATVEWSQDILADAELTAWLSLSAPTQTQTPPAFLASARYTGATLTRVYTLTASLPAGTWALQGLAHMTASSTSGTAVAALTTLQARISWRVMQEGGEQ